MTTLQAAFHRGSDAAGTIYGSAKYPPSAPAAQCLVPTAGNFYDVDVIVVSDGTVLRAGSQSWGGGFLPRP